MKIQIELWMDDYDNAKDDEDGDYARTGMMLMTMQIRIWVDDYDT